MISLTRRRILKLSLKADEKTSILVILQQGRGLRKKITFLTSNFGLSESIRSELSVFKPGVVQGSGLKAGGCGSRNCAFFHLFLAHCHEASRGQDGWFSAVIFAASQTFTEKFWIPE